MNNKSKADKSVFIGRMQPLHNGHLINIMKCIELSNNVHIIIGSGKIPRSVKNPFTDDERMLMVITAVAEELNAPIKVNGNVSTFDTENEVVTLTFHPIMDRLYSDNEWMKDVQNCVEDYKEGKIEKIVQVGHNKGEESVHLKMFPQWDFYDTDIILKHNNEPFNASDFRMDWFECNDFPNTWKDSIPASVINVIENINKANLVEEYNYLKEYPKKWGTVPFITVDTVVTALGHVLMIKRGANPGKGNYALPGGFLENNESIIDGAFRELKEETKIKVPPTILRKSVKQYQVFDHPNRSLRGRLITFAYHVELDVSEGLPQVKGGDDAAEAIWVPLSRLDNMSHKIYEDHFSIIRYFV